MENYDVNFTPFRDSELVEWLAHEPTSDKFICRSVWSSRGYRKPSTLYSPEPQNKKKIFFCKCFFVYSITQHCHNAELLETLIIVDSNGLLPLHLPNSFL